MFYVYNPERAEWYSSAGWGEFEDADEFRTEDLAREHCDDTKHLVFELTQTLG